MPGHGMRTYKNVSKTMLDTLLKDAVSNGAVVKGSNPWDIEASHYHGIMLRGHWDEGEMTLAISVLNVNWYVPKETVWKHIDEMLHGKIQQK